MIGPYQPVLDLTDKTRRGIAIPTANPAIATVVWIMPEIRLERRLKDELWPRGETTPAALGSTPSLRTAA